MPARGGVDDPHVRGTQRVTYGMSPSLMPPCEGHCGTRRREGVKVSIAQFCLLDKAQSSGGKPNLHTQIQW